MGKFINIDFYVDGLHASANPHVVGLPALTGIDGFVHTLERQFGFCTSSWSIAYRRFDMDGAHLRIANYEVGSNNSKSPSTPSTILDKRTASLEGVLIIEVNDDDGNIGKLVDSLIDGIEGFRFCGGTFMLGNESITAWETVTDSLKAVGKCSRKPHFFMEDMTHILNQAPEGLSKLDWLMDLIARPKNYDPENPQLAYECESLGYLTPVVKGYQLLETPRERQNTRFDLPHAYAESVIGLARMRSLPSVLAFVNQYQETPVIFWVNDTDDSQGNLLWDVRSISIEL